MTAQRDMVETMLLEAEQALEKSETECAKVTSQLVHEKGVSSGLKTALSIAETSLSEEKTECAKARAGEKTALINAAAAVAKLTQMANELTALRAKPIVAAAAKSATPKVIRAVVREHDANGKPSVVDIHLS